MSDNTPLPKHDNDADPSDNIVPMGGQPGARQPPPLPPTPPATAGAAPDLGWLEMARREAAHVEYECTFHAEAQFESCARWSFWSTVLGVLSAVLGALTASTIATVLGEAGMMPAVQATGDEVAGSAGGLPALWKPLLALTALVAGVITAAVRFLDPQGRAAQHGAAGKRYRTLGDEARQFRHLEATADATRDSLFNHLQTMVRHRAEIHEAAPVIPKRAYRATRARASDDSELRALALEAGQRQAA